MSDPVDSDLEYDAEIVDRPEEDPESPNANDGPVANWAQGFGDALGEGWNDWTSAATSDHYVAPYDGRTQSQFGGFAGGAQAFTGTMTGLAGSGGLRNIAGLAGQRAAPRATSAGEGYLANAGGLSWGDNRAYQGRFDALAGNAAQAQQGMQGVQGQVQGNADYLDRVQRGQAGPSLAELQLQSGLQTAQRQALGTALSGRFDPSAQRQAIQQQGALAAQANQAGAQQRAAEQLAARQLYGQALGQTQTGVGQIVDAAVQQQQINQAQQGLAQEQQAIDQQTAAQLAQMEQFNYQGQQEQQRINDAAQGAAWQTALGYDQLAAVPLTQQLAADLEYQGGSADDYYNAASLNTQVALQNAQNRQSNKNRGLFGNVLAAAGVALSDRRSKEEIDRLTTENSTLRDAFSAFAGRPTEEFGQAITGRNEYGDPIGNELGLGLTYTRDRETDPYETAIIDPWGGSRLRTRNESRDLVNPWGDNPGSAEAVGREMGADRSQRLIRERATQGPLQLAKKKMEDLTPEERRKLEDDEETARAKAVRIVDEIDPVTYKYRDDAYDAYPGLIPAAPGERVPGVIAQDLERSMPSAVYDTPAGKVVDSRQVASTALAASAAQQDQLDELEARLSGIQKGFRGGSVAPSYYETYAP